jgi:predicted nucleotidyltransferase
MTLPRTEPERLLATAMKDTDRAIALELKRRLARVARVVDFRVFGSRARGSAAEDSDLDVFVEVETVDAATREAIESAVWEVSFQHCVVISPFVVTRQELEQSALRSSSIVQTILEEGVRP